MLRYWCLAAAVLCGCSGGSTLLSGSNRDSRGNATGDGSNTSVSQAACDALAFQYRDALDEARACDPTAPDPCSAWRNRVDLIECTVYPNGTTACGGGPLPPTGEAYDGTPVIDACQSLQERAWVDAANTSALSRLDEILALYGALGCEMFIHPGCMPDDLGSSLPPPACESRDGGPALCYGLGYPYSPTGYPPCEQMTVESCTAQGASYVSQLLVPAPGRQVSLSPSACIHLTSYVNENTYEGLTCECRHTEAPIPVDVGPAGTPVCAAYSRAFGCAYDATGLAGCELGVAESCTATCQALEDAINADALHVFDASVVLARPNATGCGCDTVYEVDGVCWAVATGFPRAYDCSLGAEEILAEDAAWWATHPH